MSVVDDRLKAYADYVALDWATNLSGREKVWMIVYPPREERRIRRRLGEFELATTQAGHSWRLLDITRAFSEWFAGHPYRDEYLAEPSDLGSGLRKFGDAVAQQITDVLTDPASDESTVVALLGAGTLFGLGPIRLSRIIDDVEGSIRGRLCVFFPGERQGTNYRLLDARDGWDYLAVPIETPAEV